MIEVTTPAILFPATSLILLAYTAKMVHLGNLMRMLKVKVLQHRSQNLILEMNNLKKRIYLIKKMQAFGVFCLFFASLSMFLLLINQLVAARLTFGASLLMLLVSFYFCFREIQISAEALEIELQNQEKM